MKHLKYFSLFALLHLLFQGEAFAQSPESPVTDYVSVNTVTSKPVVSWTVTNPALINGYAVKRFIRSHPAVPDNTWHTVEVINNPGITVYEDVSTVYGEANPDIQSEIYEITAYKITGSDTTYSLPSIKHKTIFLTGEYDYCSNEITLTWNNYIGWGNNFSRYEIYAKENSSLFLKIQEKNYGDTVLKYNNLHYNSEYTFYIKAVRTDGIESFSNFKTINAQSINFPTYLKLDYAEANENNNFTIKFTPDINADTEKYVLYKNNKIYNNFSIIDSIKADNSISPELTDNNFDSEKLNYYFITCRDYCDKNIFISDTFSNIILHTEAISDKTPRINNLKWADMYSEQNYFIYRSNNNSDYNYLSETQAHSFIDDIQNIYENQFYNSAVSGKFCYYVILKSENFRNKSNISCAEQKETYFLPNAFNPKSNDIENRVFKPKVAFIESYKLTIYGHYGDIIFETDNPDKGWNGRLKNGKLAPVSSYLYFLTFKNASGKIIKLKNYVTLVY